MSNLELIAIPDDELFMTEKPDEQLKTNCSNSVDKLVHAINCLKLHTHSEVTF